MIKRFEIFLLTILFRLVFASIVHGSEYEVNAIVQTFALEKRNTNDIVFLGTTLKPPFNDVINF